ncbi:MAG: hypothetical protein HYV09_02815 [Deltaproteobacteria bacterium]|nr:hypothetical protein [Deltaproteobacteria bacterium]
MRALLAVAVVLVACGAKEDAAPVDAAGEVGDSSSASEVPADDAPSVETAPPKCPAHRVIDCGGKGECPLGTMCTVRTKPTAFMETAVPPDSWAPSDAVSDTPAGPDSADASDTPDGSGGPLVIGGGVCEPVPLTCLYMCPSSDCVCAAWGISDECVVDPDRSCREDGAIVPVVYCALR